MQNKPNIIGLVVGAILFLLSNLSYAQEPYASVYLKNGDRLTGRWLGSNEKTAQIGFQGKKLPIDLDRISTIRFATDLSLIPDALAEKHFRNGQALLELGLREEGKRQFQAAIEEFPKYADAHYKLGQLLQEDGKIDEALGYFGRVARIDPYAYNLAAVFKNAGDAYLAGEEYRKAVDAYLLLFDYYPDHQDAEYAGYAAGFVLAERLEATAEALNILQEASQRFPETVNLAKSEYLIGVLQSKAGQPQIAVNTLTTFIQNHPDSEWLDDAYVGRGDAYMQLHMNDQATADFKLAQAITTDPRLKPRIQKKREASAWVIYTVSDSLPSNDIQAIAIDGDHLWIGTPKGLAKFDVRLGTWQLLAESAIEFINELDPNVRTNVRALAVYPVIADELVIDEPMVDEPSVDELVVDEFAVADLPASEPVVEEKELWIGTLNQGVIRYNTKTGSYYVYNTLNGLPHNQIFDIDFSSDDVWVGTFSGVARFSRSTEHWTVYNREDDGLPADDIVALAVTPKTVWAGTSEAGIAIYDLEFDAWRSYDASEIIPDVVGNSIVGFDVEGLDVFFTWYSKREKSNGYGYADWEGFQGQGFPVMQSADIVPVENIHVAVGPADEMVASPTLWIATNDGVYFRYAGQWDPIGYPVDQIGDRALVNCIALSEDNAWIGTNNGLAKINTSALGSR